MHHKPPITNPQLPVTNLYLIRHGRTAWNAERRLQGHADPPLDEVGRQQAEALARRLQSETIHAFYSSPSARAHETAAIVAAPHRATNGNLSITLDTRLMERDLGLLTGLTAEQAEARFPEWAEHYRNGTWQLHGAPGGENQASLTARAAEAIDNILTAHPDQTVAVVSHGGTLHAALTHLLGIPLERHVSFRFGNTSLTHVSLDGNRIRLHSVGDDQHLGEVDK